MFSLASVSLARLTNSNENVIPDALMLSRKVAAVPPAFVSCLELARYTIQVLQKDKTKYFKTGSIGQAGLDDADLRVHDRPFINWHPAFCSFSSLSY